VPCCPVAPQRPLPRRNQQNHSGGRGVLQFAEKWLWPKNTGGQRSRASLNRQRKPRHKRRSQSGSSQRQQRRSSRLISRKPEPPKQQRRNRRRQRSRRDRPGRKRPQEKAKGISGKGFEEECASQESCGEEGDGQGHGSRTGPNGSLHSVALFGVMLTGQSKFMLVVSAHDQSNHRD